MFCLRASDSSTSHNRNSRRHPNPLPRRSTTQNTPTDYVNKLANLFTKSFSTPSTSIQTTTPNENHIATQTYDTIASPPLSQCKTNRIQPSMTTDDMRRTLKEHVRY